MESDRLSAGPNRPGLVIFDVNETLSDMSGLAKVFEENGLAPYVATTWFGGLLRDGFALTVTGANPEFATLAKASLRATAQAHGVDDAGGAADAVMMAFAQLPVHGDVVEGVRALASTGVRLVTLTNGSASVAQGLFERNGIADCFERLLSVEQAPAWKPAASAYAYALEECDVSASEAMLVAVHPWDIHGAAAAGLRTAFVNRAGNAYPPYFSPPDVEVATLVELATTIAGAPAREG